MRREAQNYIHGMYVVILLVLSMVLVSSSFTEVYGRDNPYVTLYSPIVSGYSVTINGLTLPINGSNITLISWNWGDGLQLQDGSHKLILILKLEITLSL